MPVHALNLTETLLRQLWLSPPFYKLKNGGKSKHLHVYQVGNRGFLLLTPFSHFYFFTSKTGRKFLISMYSLKLFCESEPREPAFIKMLVIVENHGMLWWSHYRSELLPWYSICVTGTVAGEPEKRYSQEDLGDIYIIILASHLFHKA